MNQKQIRALTDRVIGRDVGCGDSGCIFGTHGGMQTNGGCQCFKGDAQDLKITAYRLASLLRHVTVEDVKGG